MLQKHDAAFLELQGGLQHELQLRVQAEAQYTKERDVRHMQAQVYQLQEEVI